MTKKERATSALPGWNGGLILKYLSWGLTAPAVGLFLWGCLTGQHNIWFWGSMLALASNCLYALENCHRRIVFLLFQGTYFLFLMARPLVRGLGGIAWWDGSSPEAVFFALTALFVGLVGLRLGAQGLEWLEDRRARRTPVSRPLPDPAERETLYRILRGFALLTFSLTLAAYLTQELLMLRYMQGKAYEAYFLGRPDPPFPIGTLAAMMPAGLAVYLSALPKKKQVILPLAAYVLSAVPSFLIGLRNPLMLRLLVSFVYFVLRNGLDHKEIWIGRFEKVAVAVAILPTAAGLGAYNYIREGQEIGKLNFFSLLVDFLDKQGTSFATLCSGFSALPRMPAGMRWYTFGPLLDSIRQSRITQALFGTSSVGQGNSVTNALHGHSFAHSMSYVVNPERYLQGHGLGSSFLLESYADFGWAGVALFSILLGAATIGLTSLFRRGWFSRTVALLCLTSFFFVPRAETTTWLGFLLTPHFWLVILACRLAAKLWPDIRARLRSRFSREKGN